jgi:hypothetical protein
LNPADLKAAIILAAAKNANGSRDGNPAALSIKSQSARRYTSPLEQLFVNFDKNIFTARAERRTEL